MTANEMFRANADHTLRQVTGVFAGLEGEQWDAKVAPHAMSPRETLPHLAECYMAASTRAKGESHNWGSYKTDETDPKKLLETALAMRSAAVEAAVGTQEPDLLAELFSYIQEHDAYHVGQLCLLRIQLDPSWDPYSIYQA